MNWMMIGNRLKLWLFIARVVRVLAAITMTQYICRSVNTHTHTFLLLPNPVCTATTSKHLQMLPILLLGSFYARAKIITIRVSRGVIFHHFLCARWWETHLYVIIIKYQNDLRLVSHSSSRGGPMKFSIIVALGGTQNFHAHIMIHN